MNTLKLLSPAFCNLPTPPHHVVFDFGSCRVFIRSRFDGPDLLAIRFDRKSFWRIIEATIRGRVLLRSLDGECAGVTSTREGQALLGCEKTVALLPVDFRHEMLKRLRENPAVWREFTEHLESLGKNPKFR